jgi:hypothetical protein
MRRLVYALSLSTLVFAVCTAYLARELYRERAAGEAAPVAASTVTPVSIPAPAPKTELATTSTAASVTATAKPASPAPASASAATPPQEFTAVTRAAGEMPPDVAEKIARDVGERLARFADPAQRAALLEERRSAFRTNYSGLKDHLKMDDTEYERFIDSRVRGELKMEEAALRCYADGTCNRNRPLDRSQVEAHKREMADLFGQQRMDTFDFYMRSMGERQTVSELRGKLPDRYRLMDAQSDALVAAFYEERKRIHEDMQQRGVQVNNFNNVIYTPTIGETPDENAMQVAEEYNRRLLDRAATVLTPEQLTAFEIMQQDAMQSYRSIRTQPRN